MNKKSVVFTITAVAFVFLFSLFHSQTALSADPIILKYADPSKLGTARTRAVEETMLEIEKRTGNRVKHECYWAQSLLKSKDIFMGIRKGTCDVGDASATVYHPSRFPLWQFNQLLFVVGDDQYAVTRACNELYDTNPILKKELDNSGIQLLTTNGITPTIIFSKAPLKEPGDFEGKRIRAVGPAAKFVAAMGGTPIPMRFYETMEALARGVLDGTTSFVYASHAYKIHEYCKNLNLSGINHIIIEYWINKDVLKKMPLDVQKIYLDTWRTFYVDRMVKYHDEAHAKALSAFKKAGVNIYTLTPDQLAKWKKAAEPINEEYYKMMKKKGIDGKKIVAKYQALYSKYERKR